jgi:hypothetical protein
MNSPINTLDSSKINTSTPIKSKVKPSLFSYRLMISYRFVLALLGGYIIASLSAMVIAQYFAEEFRGGAAMSATLIAFVLWASAFIWVFMVNKTLKASIGIIVPILVLYIFYKMLGN